jgi:hypothetical protein
MPKPSRRTRIGFVLGVFAAVGLVVPGLTQAQEAEPKAPARDWALSAGCDLSLDAVPMNVSQYDYLRGDGAATVEEAIRLLSDDLARDGATFTREQLESAIASADTNNGVIEIRLPGAALLVGRTTENKYVVSQSVVCA